jgi:hypothetical protein
MGGKMPFFAVRVRGTFTLGDSGFARLLASASVCLALACSSDANEPAQNADATSPAQGAGQSAPAPAGQSSAGSPGAGTSAAGAGAQANGGAGSSGAMAPSMDPSTRPNGVDSGTGVDAGSVSDAAMMPDPATGAGLPPLADPGESGPFEIQVVESLPGLSTHILIAPKDLGRDGLKHPVLVWINGAGANSSSYRNMHDNLAAQGFAIVDDKMSSFEAIPEIDSQRMAIDWVLAQTADASSPYYGKLDPTRIAIGGHSLGSVASFGNVADPRITTSVHMAGGVTGNPGGVDNSLIGKLRAPTLFLCGSADSNGLGRVRSDFAAAPPAVPLFFGTLAGVGHTDEFNGENGGRWGRIVAAWLRWRLAGDEHAAMLFSGDACEFCTGDWTAMKRAL